jgi:formylglycine-generating enzyme required for sulfatase activity
MKVPTVNELVTMAVKERNPALSRVYKPAAEVFVGDVDLHFDADRLLFSSIGTSNRWQVFELKINPATGARSGGEDLRQVSRGDFDDIDNYDGMYLPDGRIIFDSSSTFQGVPCVGGRDYVANLHIMTADGKNVRRLTYDQDNDWYPTMMPDGRVMYTRWEYSDSAHYFSRILMRMNPDGTGQSAFYGSNSYWPNALFYCKPLPNSPSMFVGIVSGHHGVPRMGELIVFDASRGRQEGMGAVQRIPGYGKKVEPVIVDGLVNASWPKFLHPFPLSDKYFLVSAKLDTKSNWGIYLVDVFDNMVLLKEEPGFALFEPIPLRRATPPPVLPDRVDLKKTTATASIQDIYTGPGLEGVPRGTVKSLRIFQYEFSYRNMGGHYQIGMEGPWDVRRLVGTVPVFKDGSAAFEIPANTPVAIQPMDSEGKALQLMRSWLVGMPGERVSCIGCHEAQNSTIVQKIPESTRHTPVVPAPWYGPKRGFSFLREVQPVLDRNCVGCHDGNKSDRRNFADVKIIPTTTVAALPVSYLNLHPYVRRNGPEGDYTMLTPMEFHANTSELVQMLQKGHHNVKLDAESWDRIITWIDLNVPCYGAWSEVKPVPDDFAQRRQEMRKLYSNVDEDIEAPPDMPTNRVAYVAPKPSRAKPAAVSFRGWPIDAAKVMELQKALGKTELAVELGNGLVMTFRKIPAGKFVMGDINGECDEYPVSVVTIDKPFWMGVTEVSLEQYHAFVPGHMNGYYDMHYKDQVKPGYLMDDPKFPVVRISWNECMEFCKWLSKKSGKNVSLPTEAEWEWACRTGTDTAMNYGDLDSDFSKLENLGDQSLALLAVKGVNPKPVANADKFWDFVPKEERFNDGVLHLAAVDSFQPNRWGLKNMHGNVREWTLNNYRPYPWSDRAGRNDASEKGNKVVRGGSWYERPKYARSAFRLAFPEWQKIYNVGFRVVIKD